MSSKRRSKYQLVLKNDDKNSFQHVIHCLMEICTHNYYQAGQCASIVHQKGECVVYEAWDSEAKEIYDLLQAEGLNLELVKHTGQ
jgi:ATP-dependent Clp protease adaptor protein ClpS|tara:strand:- start:1368 stop:1622 length:255 start_codon:yes stop_codon:yes gene_type:complete